MAGSVVIKREDGARGSSGALAILARLIQVISMMDNVIMLFLPSIITASVEVTVFCVLALVSFSIQWRWTLCQTYRSYCKRIQQISRLRYHHPQQERSLYIQSDYCIVRVADSKLVVLLGPGLKTSCFNL